ncbi:MAG: histidine kinase dimerization/phospho-acceptor domain-containing protein [Candidatus Paceibacterales bacterium]
MNTLNYRSLYEKIITFSCLPFYFVFLLAIYFQIIRLPENPIVSFLVLISAPLILFFLYLTSYKKIFPQRVGDFIQIAVIILVISVSVSWWGEGVRASGPFFFLFFAVIVFYVLLLDPLLPWFIGSLVSGILVLEFLFSKELSRLSFLSTVDLFLKILSLLMVAFVSSNLIRRMLAEQKTTKDLRKTTKELRIAYRNIKALSEMKSEFLKVVNHQLRTPVSIIKGMLSMMAEGSVKGEKLNEYIEKAYLSSERLSTILDDILLAQSLVGGGEKVKLSSCQIEEIVEAQIEYFKPLAKTKNLKIIFEKPEKALPLTFADSEMIERAISRLIDNAILYTEKGEIKVSVKLKRREDKQSIQISVKDPGIGLDKEDKKNLFKLFYRGKKATSLHPNG